MSFIRFDHTQLVNLNYSLVKELIRSNKGGGYTSSTIIFCNTRKYHGLLVVPQPELDDDLHVLLSGIDESIINMGMTFQMGIHKYPNLYDPKGHKYITDFTVVPHPIWHYQVGDISYQKEVLLKTGEDRVMIRYKIEKSSPGTVMRFKPYLAFRNFHRLSKANIYANSHFTPCKNGVSFRLYNSYDPLFIQFSHKANYVHAPDWYYNILYLEEKERGYDYAEDLMVPGFFEIPVKAGDEFVISAGTSEASPATFKKAFSSEAETRPDKSEFRNCLFDSARQFICTDRNGKTSVKAGLHWFGQWGRDTFISLPGLTLTTGDKETFLKVIDDYIPDMRNGLFPNVGKGDRAVYNTVDASMWFIWALQQYVLETGKPKDVWKKYKGPINEILNSYRHGTLNNIKMHSNGLVWAGREGVALTWMDAVVDGAPVTPRIGYCVEINALWYNAVNFALELAGKAGDKEFAAEWKDIPAKTKQSFNQLFWNGTSLADVVGENGADFAVRSNQVIACSMDYCMLDNEDSRAVLYLVKNELLTPRGLRTLTPKNPMYHGTYEGDQKNRDRAYHQGTVWVWQMEHFANAYLKLFGKEGVEFIEEIYNGFEPTMAEDGIGTVNEIFDGNPPHLPRGAISQAWSVGALLRIEKMIEKYSELK